MKTLSLNHLSLSILFMLGAQAHASYYEYEPTNYSFREFTREASKLEEMIRPYSNPDLRFAASRLENDAQSFERCAMQGRRPQPGTGGYPYPQPGNSASSDITSLKQRCGFELRQVLLSLSEVEYQVAGSREYGALSQVQRLGSIKESLLYSSSGTGGSGGYPAPSTYRAFGSLDRQSFDYTGFSPADVKLQCVSDLNRRSIFKVGCLSINGTEYGQMCRMPSTGGVTRGMTAEEACNLVAQNAVLRSRY